MRDILGAKLKKEYLNKDTSKIVKNDEQVPDYTLSNLVEVNGKEDLLGNTEIILPVNGHESEGSTTASGSCYDSSDKDSISNQSDKKHISHKPMVAIPLTIRTTKVISKINKHCENHKSENFKSKRKRNMSPNTDGNSGLADFKKIKQSDTNAEGLLLKRTNRVDRKSHISTEYNLESECSGMSEQKSNHNQVYQGLLNDGLYQDKDSGDSIVRKKLSKIARKELEEMIIEQFMTKFQLDHELGQQRELCNRLESTLEAANKKALRLTKEVEALKDVTAKLTKEHMRRKSQLIIPVKMKRSVGIQAKEAFINEGFASVNKSYSAPYIIIPSKYKDRAKNDSESVQAVTANLLERTRKLAGILRGNTDTQVSHSSEQVPELNQSRLNSNHLSTDEKERFGVCISSTAAKTKQNGKKLQCNYSSDAEAEVIVDEFYISKRVLHQSSPSQCNSVQNNNNKILPPPSLLVYQRNKSIVLSWDLDTCVARRVTSYQLFSYDEDKVHSSRPPAWKKIGSVKALELPMACTLTQLKRDRSYYFAVRAVDVHGTLGPFSPTRSIKIS